MIERPIWNSSRALAAGAETGFGDQYMYMVPQFEVGDDACAGLAGSLFIARGRLAGPKRIGYEVARVV